MFLPRIVRCTAFAACTLIASAAAAGTSALPAASSSTLSAATDSTAASPIRVESAWVRAAPAGAEMLAGYLTMRNSGRTPVRFVSASSDLFGTVRLHRSEIARGMSTMRPAGEQVIGPGAVLAIQPGGLHLMLMQPKHPLAVGDRVRFRLHFAAGPDVEAIAVVAIQAPPVR